MYTAQNITYDEFARPSYDLVVQGEIVNRITLGVTGEHNVYNSLAAIAVAMELGIGFDAIMSGLKNFKGTDRRFEKKGEIGGVTIIDARPQLSPSRIPRRRPVVMPASCLMETPRTLP